MLIHYYIQYLLRVSCILQCSPVVLILDNSLCIGSSGAQDSHRQTILTAKQVMLQELYIMYIYFCPCTSDAS